MQRIFPSLGAYFFATLLNASPAEVSIGHLIATLQDQGHRIIYSSRLVAEGTPVRVEAANLAELTRVLAELGLTLEQDGDLILIVRDPAHSPLSTSAVPPRDPERSGPKLETVIVTGSLHRFPYDRQADAGKSISSSEIASQPAMASDPLRVVTRLPGVSTVGISARPHIRGGLNDELLIMRDGVELLEPFHMADFHSVYSAIDRSNIESMHVYTGGFPARYGNRMSGVLDMSARRPDDGYNVDIGISTFADRLTVQGETNWLEGTDFLLSWREGDLDALADFIERESGIPEYRDASASASFTLPGGSGLTFGATYARDDIVFLGDSDSDEGASSRVETNQAWVQFDTDLKNGLSTRLSASVIDLSRRNLQVNDEEEDEGGFLDHRQDVLRVALRNDWTGKNPGYDYEFGWQAEFNRGRYFHRSEIDRGVFADIIGTPRRESRLIDVAPDGWSGGAYMQLELPLTERLELQPSIRVDVQDYYLEQEADLQWSPRLGVNYWITSELKARLSIGRFNQPEGIQELQVLDGVGRFFSTQQSDQIVAGLLWQRFGVQLSAEAYHKRYRQQKARFENVFNPFVLLPAMEGDRVRIDPDGAYAQGFDLETEFELSPSLHVDFRYSYMDSKDRIDGRYIDRRWAQTHTINSGIALDIGTLTIAGAATWHSGWRSSRLPTFVPDGDTVPLSEFLNNTELRDFFSLDLSAHQTWESPWARFELFADISNVTNRKNQAGIDFDEERVDGGYTLAPDIEVLLGRVISVGVNLSF